MSPGNRRVFAPAVSAFADIDVAVTTFLDEKGATSGVENALTGGGSGVVSHGRGRDMSSFSSGSHPPPPEQTVRKV